MWMHCLKLSSQCRTISGCVNVYLKAFPMVTDLCAKQTNGFTTYADVALEASESTSNHFRLYNCLSVKSHKGFRTAIWSIHMVSKTMWCISDRAKVEVWALPWLQNDCTIEFNGLSADMNTVLKTSKQLLQHVNWTHCFYVCSPTDHRPNVRSNSMISRFMCRLFLKLSNQCRTMPFV